MEIKFKINIILWILALTSFSTMNYANVGYDYNREELETHEVLSISDFEYERSTSTAQLGRSAKTIYKSSKTKKLWAISAGFTMEDLIEYIAGSLYRLKMGDRAPKIRLILDKKRQLRVGSEFIEDFISISDLFRHNDAVNARIRQKAFVKALNGAPMDQRTDAFWRAANIAQLKTPAVKSTRRCFPQGCLISAKHLTDDIKSDGKVNLTFGYADEVLAMMFILTDQDGNVGGVGAVNDYQSPYDLETCKIDHNKAFYVWHSPFLSLRGRSKTVFGQGSTYYLDWDYKKFSGDKVAETFDWLAELPHNVLPKVVQLRLKEVLKEKVKNTKLKLPLVLRKKSTRKVFKDNLISQLKQAQENASFYALSIRVEDVIMKDDLDAFMQLLADKVIDLDSKIEYIHANFKSKYPQYDVDSIVADIENYPRGATHDYLLDILNDLLTEDKPKRLLSIAKAHKAKRIQRYLKSQISLKKEL